MVSDAELYDVFWTPEFTEDVYAAVSYIAEELGNPVAAERMLDGIEALLDSKRAMPTAATTYVGSTGTMRYIARYRRFDVHYVIEGRTIKAIGLKHQLQGSSRTTLPRES